MEYRNSGQLEFRIRDKSAGVVEARTNQLEVIDDYISAFASGFWDGAVKRSGKLPKILVDHEGRRAGRVTDTKQVRSADGLFQHSTLQYDLESRYGAEAFHDLQAGNDDEFSHGFVTAKQHMEKRDGQNVTIKDECRMWPEISQVLAGASPGTGPLSIRSALALLGVKDIRAAVSSMQADCPYCSGNATNPADCTCESDCGAANCPMADAAQQRSYAEEMISYRAVAVKEGAPKSPPAGYPSESSKYADPTNYKYPIDTDARIHAAISYFNHDGQQEAGGYSDSEWASIGRKIASAANEAFGAGHSYSSGKIQTPSDTQSGRSAPILASGATALDTRIGAQFSAANKAALQAAHDALVSSGAASCGPPTDEAGRAQRSPSQLMEKYHADLKAMGITI